MGHVPVQTLTRTPRGKIDFFSNKVFFSRRIFTPLVFCSTFQEFFFTFKLFLANWMSWYFKYWVKPMGINLVRAFIFNSFFFNLLLFFWRFLLHKKTYFIVSLIEDCFYEDWWLIRPKQGWDISNLDQTKFWNKSVINQSYHSIATQSNSIKLSFNKVF